MPGLPLDHVGIAVRSLDEGVALWERLLGATATDRERIDDQGVEVAFIGEGEARLELLSPTRPNSPVAHFLDRRGPGVHHLAFRVPDLAATLVSLREEGYSLVDEEPRAGAHGRRIAFLHPRATGGVLVELVEG